MAASQARNTQSQAVEAGTQKIGRLDESEKKTKITDLVFYILSTEKGRPLHNRANMMKAVELTGKNKQDQEEVLNAATGYLEDVFGLTLQSLEDAGKRGQYLLINSLTTGLEVIGDVVDDEDDDDGEEDVDGSQEKARTALLFSLLALVFMSPGQVVRDDVMDPFLIQMGLLPQLDATSADAGDVEAKVRKTFGVDKGDVKALIKDEFVKKQHYIDLSEITDGADTEHKMFEYRWGIRANCEMRKAEILRIVAEMYDCPLTDFKEQYDLVANSNEADALNEDDDGDREEATEEN